MLNFDTGGKLFALRCLVLICRNVFVLVCESKCIRLLQHGESCDSFQPALWFG